MFDNTTFSKASTAFAGCYILTLYDQQASNRLQKLLLPYFGFVAVLSRPLKSQYSEKEVLITGRTLVFKLLQKTKQTEKDSVGTKSNTI